MARRKPREETAVWSIPTQEERAANKRALQRELCKVDGSTLDIANALWFALGRHKTEDIVRRLQVRIDYVEGRLT
jgi:hypothetical protein